MYKFKKNTLIRLFIYVSIVHLGQLSLNAATLTVDSEAGAAQYQTIQAALNQAVAGDTVLVNAGNYRERIEFKSGGTVANPVILEGKPGAVLDASDNVSLNWQLDTSIGPGVYKATVSTLFPYTIIADGKSITTVDEKTADELSDPYDWIDIFNDGGIDIPSWSAVKALAMYRDAENELIIRFDGLLNPNSMNITLGPKEDCVLIDGFDHCIVRGLTIRNAAWGVRIENSVGSIVEDCTIGPVDYGVFLGTGSDSCTIRNNDITFAPYADFNPLVEANDETWRIHKRAGFSDRYAIRVTISIGGHDIHDNFIYEQFDGIQVGQTGTNSQNGDVDVHHNYITTILDDGMETSNGQVNNQWHDNVVEKCRRGTRIKSPNAGPLYIYRNIYLENKSDIVAYSNSTVALEPAEVWVYHNTTTADSAIGIDYSDASNPSSITTPDYHFHNNFHWCISADTNEIPDWNGDYNVYVRVNPDQRPWVTSGDADTASTRMSKWNNGISTMNTAGIEVNSLWLEDGIPGFSDITGRDVSLTVGSPARTFGLDLSQGQTLPGAGPGYFSGAKPDVGALQFGETMPLLRGMTAPVSYALIESEADTYVRGGSNANNNTGSEDELWVKEDSGSSNDRKVFLRFDLSTYSETISSATLQLMPVILGNNVATSSYQVLLVSDDTWQENTVTWNNSPAGSTVVANINGSDIIFGKVLEIDVSSIAAQEQAGDGNLSLVFVSLSSGTGRHVVFTSNESGTNSPALQLPPTAGGAAESLGTINKGVAAIDSATGSGFIMWTQQDVFTRFNPDPHTDNSTNLIAVLWNGSQWLYDNNSTTTVFTPVSTDVLIAAVSFSSDSITSLEGTNDVYNGIARGYASGDLSFIANQWGGSANPGEFTVTGSSFVKNASGPASMVFDVADFTDYASQTGAGSTLVLESGDTAVRMTGNIWQKYPFTYTVTVNTMLEVTVAAPDTGEILGIGLDSDNNYGAGGVTNFQLSGSQSPSSFQILSPTYTAGEGAVTYVIPVGSFFTGSMNYLTFTGDDDGGQSIDVTFSNIRVYEE